MGTFEVYRDRRNEYRWRLRAGNNRNIADSGEGYQKKSACLHGIELVRCSDDFEIFQDKKGEFRWKLRASNGRVIADSGEGYPRRYNCRRAIATVKRVAPEAGIKDQTPSRATSTTDRSLTAAFNVEPRAASEPLMVSFDSAPTEVPVDAVISCTWDFGDGITGTGLMIDHMFEEPGTFPVALVVVDEFGTTDTLIQTITVPLDLM